MNKGIITMSVKEVSRLEVVQKVVNKQLKVQQASEQLGIGMRQVKRLTKAYLTEGAPGLISKHRGKVSANRIDATRKDSILQLVSSKYVDFGPTLACEKLGERDGLTVSKETLRKWIHEAGLWSAKSRRVARVHQQRERRSCFGELVQIDGSPHDWFEGRSLGHKPSSKHPWRQYERVAKLAALRALKRTIAASETTDRRVVFIPPL